jgi:hypothetical protein
LTLHECPRKFELDKLNHQQRAPESYEDGITFAFGHAFGEGVQLALQGKSWEEILFTLFVGWKPELFAENLKQKKSFWTALTAVSKFYQMKDELLDGWELMYYNGKPSCELSARIHLPNGFKYRLHIDAVLKHAETGQVKVLETKTSSAKTLNPAMYKNSAQGVGYSVVIDKLAGELSDYEVLYLPYQTLSQEFTPMPFTKTFLQRALWLRELLLDVDIIQMYHEAGVFPMRGESCISRYGRDCKYLHSCTMDTSYQTKVCREEDVDQKEYDIEVTLEELLEAQFSKMEGN